MKRSPKSEGRIHCRKSTFKVNRKKAMTISLGDTHIGLASKVEYTINKMADELVKKCEACGEESGPGVHSGCDNSANPKCAWHIPSTPQNQPLSGQVHFIPAKIWCLCKLEMIFPGQCQCKMSTLHADE